MLIPYLLWCIFALYLNIGIAILRAINMQVFRSLLGFSISIVNIIISIYLCKSYGAVGAAIGTAISLIIGEVFIMNIYYYKQVKLDMIKFWGNIVRILPSMFIPVIFGGLILLIIGLKILLEHLGVIKI